MFVEMLKQLWGDQRGGTVIEYGLIAALIIMTMIGAFIQVANSTTAMWGNVNNKVSAATAGN